MLSSIGEGCALHLWIVHRTNRNGFWYGRLMARIKHPAGKCYGMGSARFPRPEHKGNTMEGWRELTDDDLEVIRAIRQKLRGLFQEHAGIANEALEQQTIDFPKPLHQAAFSKQKSQRAGRSQTQS